MEADFLDLVSKAKELGINEGALRARILSGKEICFVYAANSRAYAEKGEWLPAWDDETFPLVEWIDHGSVSRDDFASDPHWGWPPHRRPHYHLSGWVGLDRGVVETVLTRGEDDLDLSPVYVFSSERKAVCCLRLRADPKKEWVTAGDVYEDGGYWREVPIKLTIADLFIPATESNENKTLSPRKEQSYLGIIAAMRALLREKDGGGFPSEAKLIDQLVLRFGTTNGVSKRNLETVFAAATRASDDLTPTR